jgi:uncharacterized paraquat-inducible protein A
MAKVRCPECGNVYRVAGDLSGQRIKCRACGSRVEVPASASARAEEFLLRDYNVSVTSARFMVGSTTYAIAGITSVGFKSNLWIQNALFFFALIGAIFGLAVLICGALFPAIFVLFMAVICLWLAPRFMPEYSVILTTAAGEIRAITSRDRAFIGRIVQALNDAIEFRK